jgi:hypothetical protein
MQLLKSLERLLPDAYTSLVLRQNYTASRLLSTVLQRFDQLETRIQGGAPPGAISDSLWMGSPTSAPCAVPAPIAGTAAIPQKSPRFADGSATRPGTGGNGGDAEQPVEPLNTQDAAAHAAEACLLLGSQDSMSLSQLGRKAARDIMAGPSQSSLHLSQLHSQHELSQLGLSQPLSQLLYPSEKADGIVEAPDKAANN